MEISKFHLKYDRREQEGDSSSQKSFSVFTPSKMAPYCKLETRSLIARYKRRIIREEMGANRARKIAVKRVKLC